MQLRCLAPINCWVVNRSYMQRDKLPLVGELLSAYFPLFAGFFLALARLFRLRPALVLRFGNSLLGFGAHGPSLCTRLLRHDRRNDLRGSAGMWLLRDARQ
jgi:hypothetical protein